MSKYGWRWSQTDVTIMFSLQNYVSNHRGYFFSRKCKHLMVYYTAQTCLCCRSFHSLCLLYKPYRPKLCVPYMPPTEKGLRAALIAYTLYARLIRPCLYNDWFNIVNTIVVIKVKNTQVGLPGLETGQIWLFFHRGSILLNSFDEISLTFLLQVHLYF